ncbi:DUF2339 domain-containing protein [Planctobacterium marinum]|uniref:Membrane protein n=1 Tax=Planctobacterium marinum TaxID=1631968 RepID=A0AA48HVJ7_9ALTE|nr:membrane protein [Planctobacterium marinum]
MEMTFGAVLLALFLFVGAVISFQNRGEINRLTKLNKTLNNRIELLNIQLNKLQSRLDSLPLQTDESAPASATEKPKSTDNQTLTAEAANSSTSGIPSAVSALAREHDSKAESALPINALENEKPKQVASKSKSFAIELWLKNNMLLWTGALVLALGGIFLAKFAIEAGLISPEIRIFAGAAFGLSLLVGAEYLNRNAKRFAIHSKHIVAAIASGGSITCFAMVMVAWDVYQFIAMPIAFGLMASISLIAISLALRYGPIMAAVGIVGAYLVPMLVSSGSGNVSILLSYVCFISAAAIWVNEKVQKPWLWWLSFTGHFLWFLAATLISEGNDAITILCSALISIYLFVLSGVMGWRLQHKMQTPLPVTALLMPRKEQLPLLLSVLFVAFSIAQQTSDTALVITSLVLSGVLLWVSFRYSAFDSWPFVALIFCLFSLSFFTTPEDFTDNLFPFSGGYLFAQLMALSFTIYTAFSAKLFPERSAYLLLLIVAPIGLLAVSYFMAPVTATNVLTPLWLFELLILSAVSCFVANKSQFRLHKITWLLLSNASVTLALSIALSESLLTLALLVQVALMCYLTQKYLVPLPDWIYKVAILVATARLTFSPWIGSYAEETLLGIHWTLLIYPGAVFTLFLAHKFSTSAPLKAWLTGAILHVIALFVTTETSWWFTGGYPVFSALTFHESVILSLNWMILGGVYLWRQKLNKNNNLLYQVAGTSLLTFALLLHVKLTLLNSPYFSQLFVGEGLVNWLIPLWAVPALILLLLCHKQLLSDTLQQPAKIIAGVFSFLFINGMIRNQFQQGSISLAAITPQSELYAYSIVWLLLATTCIFVAHSKNKEKIKKLGFGLLAMVVLKAFLVDMANLEGLYRALSFIGLGLSLVGIGWLFQKIQKPSNDNAATI